MAAVVIAWRSIPKDVQRSTAGVDILGAVLLGIGTLGVLLAVAQPSVWDTPWVGASILVLAAIALSAWAFHQRRAAAPLVDLDLFVTSRVLRANTAMLTSGIGMYLLFSLLTRYVQTPASAGYGFGLSGLLAGAALIPFSALGFVAGRLTPRLTDRVTARWTYVFFAAFVIVAAGLFSISPGSIISTLTAMALLGFGVGGVSAIMPRLVLDEVPQTETSSVLSLNQIVRSIGFSIGSALAGLLLANATPTRTLFPTEDGYAIAALWALPLLIISVGPILLTTHARRSS